MSGGEIAVVEGACEPNRNAQNRNGTQFCRGQFVKSRSSCSALNQGNLAQESPVVFGQTNANAFRDWVRKRAERSGARQRTPGAMSDPLGIPAAARESEFIAAPGFDELE